ELASQAEQLQTAIAYFRTDEQGAATPAPAARPIQVEHAPASAPRAPAKPVRANGGAKPAPVRVAKARLGNGKANGGFALDLSDGGDALDAQFQRH
ncbi:hypothetical protein TSO221_15370, partial [Azospirillum sp. TSO22-1]